MDENYEIDEVVINEGKQSNSKLVKIALIAAITVVVAAAAVLLSVFVLKPALQYAKASSLEKKGEYALAFEAFDRMGDYRDAAARKAEIQEKRVSSRTEQEIDFGGYKWLVLEERDQKALVITKDIVENRPYNTELTAVSWESCTLRKYLNESFYSKFSDEEKARILTTRISNGANPENGAKNGKDTDDKVFLLSLEEANLYFAGNSLRMAKYDGFNGYWWLRSSGAEGMFASTVTSDGSFAYTGSGVNYNTRGVRPAMWITMA